MTTYYDKREKESFTKLCSLLERLDVNQPMIFDVGANIGQSVTLFKKEFPDCSLHSFEPNPAIFKALTKDWGGKKNIFLHQKALNSVSGVVEFYVTNVPEASSILHPHPKLMKLSVDNKYDFKKIDVECITLDNFCEINAISKIDILKVDVQGAELEVLKGADKILSSGSVSVLYVESNFAESYSGQMKFEDLLIYCSQRGYQLWDVSPFVYTRTGRLWTANTILLNNKIIHDIETSWNQH